MPRFDEHPSEASSQEATTTYRYGRHPVLEALEHQPERVAKVYLAEGLNPDRRISQIQSLCKKQSIPLSIVPRVKLDRMLSEQLGEDREGRGGVSGTTFEAPHQGVIAIVTAVALLSVEDLIALPAKDDKPALVVMLDGVKDPHNVGAILRICDGVGAKGLILPKHRGSVITPTVAKVACGAEESVPVAITTNLTQALEKFKAVGYWSVGAVLNEKAQPYWQHRYDAPMVLVMGEEESGIRPNLQKHCDFLAYIPMAGQLNSMNVASATAVLAFEMARQQGRLVQSPRLPLA